MQEMRRSCRLRSRSDSEGRCIVTCRIRHACVTLQRIRISGLKGQAIIARAEGPGPKVAHPPKPQRRARSFLPVPRTPRWGLHLTWTNSSRACGPGYFRSALQAGPQPPSEGSPFYAQQYLVLILLLSSGLLMLQAGCLRYHSLAILDSIVSVGNPGLNRRDRA